MKQLVTVFLMLATLNAHATHAALVYVCNIEASTGFAYKHGKWRVTQFNDVGQKFLLRTLKADDPGFNVRDKTTYGVFEIGRKIPQLFFSIHDELTHISCSGVGELFFSSETGRFLRTYPLGYVFPEDDKKVSPKIMRGSCLRIMDEQHY